MKRTEITCEEIPSYICATQLAGGVLLKKLKKIKIMLNIFKFSLGVKIFYSLNMSMQINFHELPNHFS